VPGQILRREISAHSVTAEKIRAAIPAGELLLEELIDRVVRERLEAVAPEQGFVLEGYPRTTAEAEALRETLARLDRLLPRPILLCLEVAQDELVHRLRRRRQCEGRADDAERAIARASSFTSRRSTLDAPTGRRAWKPPSTSPRDAGETDLSSPT
jgi:adenylate kinase